MPKRGERTLRCRGSGHRPRYHAVTRRLIDESRGVDRGILVLFVDDVQWADPATLEFLSYLARCVVSEPVLLLFAYRREDSL